MNIRKLALAAMVMAVGFSSMANAAKSLQELLIRFMMTAQRAEFVQNAAKHCKEEVRYGKT